MLQGFFVLFWDGGFLRHGTFRMLIMFHFEQVLCSVWGFWSLFRQKYSVDVFRQMVVLYRMCKDVLFSRTEFQLSLLRVWDYVHFLSWI